MLKLPKKGLKYWPYYDVDTALYKIVSNLSLFISLFKTT